ncbi:MAG: iron-sulfur cluster repair di-iron protein [Bacteroidetes bacterium]|nr:iron-sulfur cluster repair di-iron protein [Bacteroidota bacterium]
MINFKNKTIAEIVSNDISTASIFKKYNIDFCCGGGKTIEKACKDAEIEINNLVDELNSNINQSNIKLNFNDWEIGFLIDYIVNVHHSYIKKNIPIINSFGQKVSRVHGERNVEIIEVVDLFSKMTQDLILHTEKEETLLFPEIKYLVKQSNKLDKAEDGHDKIEIFEYEHEEAGIIAKRIITLTNNFKAPENACNTYKAFYFKLEEFINDLFQHIHLENNILFRKVRNL